MCVDCGRKPEAKGKHAKCTQKAHLTEMKNLKAELHLSAPTRYHMITFLFFCGLEELQSKRADISLGIRCTEVLGKDFSC